MAKGYLSDKKTKNPELLFKSSLIEEILGNYNAGISDISKAIELNPREAKYYYTRGRLYSNKGNMKEAVSNFSKVIELFPSNPYVYYELYSLYKSTPEKEKAIENLSKFIKIAPFNTFKRLIMDIVCQNMIFIEKRDVEGCPKKDFYEKKGFGFGFKDNKEMIESPLNLTKNCCEYECETFTTKCCLEYECTDYDYYTNECTNWKCKKLTDCTKERCKCTKLCEEK